MFAAERSGAFSVDAVLPGTNWVKLFVRINGEVQSSTGTRHDEQGKVMPAAEPTCSPRSAQCLSGTTVPAEPASANILLMAPTPIPGCFDIFRMPVPVTWRPAPPSPPDLVTLG